MVHCVGFHYSLIICFSVLFAFDSKANVMNDKTRRKMTDQMNDKSFHLQALGCSGVVMQIETLTYTKELECSILKSNIENMHVTNYAGVGIGPYQDFRTVI